MPQLAERQSEFANALLDPRGSMPLGCIGPDRRPDEKRFAVYRNNVMASLIEALRESFPAVCRLVGEEYFRAFAGEYAARHPPNSPIMLEYGKSFPEFIEQFEPLRTLPYLPDVARIERAWLQAYHAVDAPWLDPRDLAGIADERAADICFGPHPSLSIIRSSYPAVTIWRRNIADGEPQPIALESGGENILIIRRDVEVDVRALGTDAATFLTALASGRPLGEAAAAALSACQQFDVASHLAALIEGGLFSRCWLSPQED